MRKCHLREQLARRSQCHGKHQAVYEFSDLCTNQMSAQQPARVGIENRLGKAVGVAGGQGAAVESEGKAPNVDFWIPLSRLQRPLCAECRSSAEPRHSRMRAHGVRCPPPEQNATPSRSPGRSRLELSTWPSRFSSSEPSASRKPYSGFCKFNSVPAECSGGNCRNARSSGVR